jgi:hypothetical protein
MLGKIYNIIIYQYLKIKNNQNKNNYKDKNH